jgi:serine/threonine protein kinase/WD40 repeat protein
MDPLSNRIVKGYEFREPIGKGAFGAVYRASQPAVGREVAIKVILPKFANQPDFVRRFEAEAQVIARLEHPHIVPLYDYWRDPDGAYLVMRWLKRSLRESLGHGSWSLDSTARLLDSVAAALAVAHRDGIVHRDIKPENILLDEDDNAYLADFGIALDENIRDPAEDDDVIVGSPAYISPEQIRSGDITAQSDLYSLGYVLYEMLTGSKPFPDASTASDYIQRHLNNPLPMLSAQSSKIPAAVDEVLQTATAKDPAHRYASALRFASAFRAAIPTSQPRGLPQPLAEPLTERELEVLRLMMDGLTNAEIAQKLFLTLQTVRWYVSKQIYPKLDAHSRQQAVDRAQALKLFEPKTSTPVSSRPIPDTPTMRLIEPPPALVLDAENPYKGLRAFQEADEADFFGRAALVEGLLNRLSQGSAGERFLAVVGPSGSGKSSVVRAGLIPALRRGTLSESPRPFIADMLPGTHPLEELEAALLRVAIHPIPDLMEQLRDDRRGLVRAAKRLLPNEANTELILVIDQFEELFTLTEDDAARQHFINNLLAAAADPRGRIRIIVTLRADFYDKPLMFPRLAELMRANTEIVVPLNARELEQAILAPAERVGLRLQDGLTATIIGDVSEQPGMLPLLQYALTELYERREGVTLTVDAYNAIGGVTGALARRADDLYASLDEVQQAAARQLFLRLVTLGEGTEDTRRRAPLPELQALSADQSVMDDLITVFSQYRLLTLDRDPLTRLPTVEVAHEALIRRWDRLRDWLNDARDDVRLQRSLASAAAEWELANRDTSYLLTGARLEQFSAWGEMTDLALTRNEQAFLNESITEYDRAAAAEQERLARELKLAQDRADAQRQSANRLRGLVAVLVVGVIAALLLSGVAVSQSNEAQVAQLVAEQSAADLRSIALAFGAEEAFNNYQPDVALALAAESINLADPPLQAMTTFNQVNQSNWMQQRFVGGHDYVWDAAFLHDGEHVITTGFMDNTVNKWHIDSGEIVQSVQLEQIAGGIALHPEMDVIAIASAPNRPPSGIVIWNLETGDRFTLASDLSETFLEPEFSPDGSRLFSTAGGTAYVWDVSTWELIDSIRIFEGENEVIQHINLSNDGAFLTAACRCPAVKIVAIENGEVLHTRSHPDAEWVWTSDFLLDSAYVLIGHVGDDTSYVELWNWQDEEQIWEYELTGHPTIHWVQYLEVSPDGRWFALATDATALPYSLQLHETQTGRLLHEYYGHTSRLMRVRFSSDGRSLLTTSRDGTAAIWTVFWDGTEAFNLLPESSVGDPSVHPTQPLFIYSAEDVLYMGNYETGEIIRSWNIERIMRPVFSPDGQYFVAGEWLTTKPLEEQNAYIWSTATGELLFTLDEHDGWILDVDFSPIEPIVAISQGANNRILLWQYETGELLQRLEGPHSDHPAAIAFSPDGNSLFSGDHSGVLVQWNVTTGEVVRYFEGHSESITSLDVNSDGTRLLSSGEFTHLWDIETASIVTTLPANQIFTSEFSPDSTRIVTLSRESALQMWDVETGLLLRQYSVQNGIMPHGFAYTSEGENILMVADEYLIVMDGAINDTSYESAIIENRYLPDFTCEQRALYIVEPFCETEP